jgi:hypothetical protein
VTIGEKSCDYRRQSGGGVSGLISGIAYSELHLYQTEIKSGPGEKCEGKFLVWGSGISNVLCIHF